MNVQQDSSSNPDLTMRLEIVPEEKQHIDHADIDEVGRSLFYALNTHGYTVKPVPTGTRGGGPLFDILFFLQNNQDWLLNLLPAVLQCLLIAREQRAQKEQQRRTPLKITLEAPGRQISIEVTNPKDALMLIEQLQQTSGAKVKKAPPQPEIKIQVRVPPKKRSRSR